jgi:hypothetical protein
VTPTKVWLPLTDQPCSPTGGGVVEECLVYAAFFAL